MRGARLDTVELAVYRYGRDVWSICADGDELPSGLYQDGGIPGASGVLCACLTKSTR